MNILQFGMSLDLTEAELMYSRNDTDGITHAIRNQFTKKFSLPTYIHHSTKNKHHCNAKCQRKPGFKLPNTSRWFQKSNKNWDDAKLVSMKADLNKIKSLLNEKPLIEWHRHTRFRNPAADVISRIREVGENPELLTQAWCKFTECIVQYELMNVYGHDPYNGDVFHSAHLCEAPGAFITALNHYIKTQDNQNHPKYGGNVSSILDLIINQKKGKATIAWEWLGSTLNPYYEGNPTSSMINDDRFILHTLKTNENNSGWIFGPDTTGNMLKKDNLEGLIGILKDRGGMHLITADGSVDCQANPGDQENMVSHLHFIEIVAALLGLRDGGNFVMKMFTFFEPQTISSLYLLSNLFREVNIFKPATSKEGNSEVYVICKGFSNCLLSEEMKKVLLENVELLSDYPLFQYSDINCSFMEKVNQCSKYFKDLQTNAILTNIQSFERKTKWRRENKAWSDYQIKDFRERIADEFVELYNIQPIKNEQRIVPILSKVDRGSSTRNRSEERKKANQLPGKKITELQQQQFVQ